MEVRKAHFAGSWYPAEAAECERQIERFLSDAQGFSTPACDRVGGIVPHAGWYFSGAIACSTIARLRDAASPDVVVIFGMHLHPASSCFIMAEGAWETPFGALRIESRLARALIERFDFTVETAARHIQDNTVELQLPFVKYLFPQAAIVPVGAPPRPVALQIGRAAIEEAQRLEMTAKVIGSTDLTHYGSNYGFGGHGRGASAVEWVRDENDRRIIEAMLAMTPEKVIEEALANQNACCSGAAAAAIAAGRQLGASRAETVAYATSYDRHPAESFVGYVGIVF